MNKKPNNKVMAVVSANGISLKRPKERGGLVRVQLDLPQDRIDELNRIMGKVNLDTRKDLFNNALSIFAWAVKEKEKGHLILSLDEDTNTYKELVMPPLETIADKKREKRGD